MANIEKRGYKVYADWRNWLKLLSDYQKARWVDWVWDYMNNEEKEAPQDQALLMAINMARNVIDIDKEFYDKKVNAGKKGGITTQLKQNQAKSSKVKQNEAKTSTDNQVEADMIRKDMICKDMIRKDMICKDISLKEENDRIDALQKLIQEIEILFGRTLVKDKKDIVIKMYDDFGYDKTLSTIKNYKDKNDAIKYANTVLHNLATPKEEKQTETPKQINSWMDAWKISQDETAPQYLRDEALEYLEKH